MTALTAAYDTRRKDGELIAYAVAAGAHLQKGALVSVVSATGLAQPGADAAGTVFVGVAYEGADNTSGAAGAISLRVLKTGVFVYAKAGAALTDIGKTVFISDDNTVSAAATTNNIACGTVVSIPDAGHVQVRIDGKVA